MKKKFKAKIFVDFLSLGIIVFLFFGINFSFSDIKDIAGYNEYCSLIKLNLNDKTIPSHLSWTNITDNLVKISNEKNQIDGNFAWYNNDNIDCKNNGLWSDIYQNTNYFEEFMQKVEKYGEDEEKKYIEIYKNCIRTQNDVFNCDKMIGEGNIVSNVQMIINTYCYFKNIPDGKIGVVTLNSARKCCIGDQKLGAISPTGSIICNDSEYKDSDGCCVEKDQKKECRQPNDGKITVKKRNLETSPSCSIPCPIDCVNLGGKPDENNICVVDLPTPDGCKVESEEKIVNYLDCQDSKVYLYVENIDCKDCIRPIENYDLIKKSSNVSDVPRCSIDCLMGDVVEGDLKSQNCEILKGIFQKDSDSDFFCVLNGLSTFDQNVLKYQTFDYDETSSSVKLKYNRNGNCAQSVIEKDCESEFKNSLDADYNQLVFDKVKNYIENFDKTDQCCINKKFAESDTNLYMDLCLPELEEDCYYYGTYLEVALQSLSYCPEPEEEVVVVSPPDDEEVKQIFPCDPSKECCGIKLNTVVPFIGNCIEFGAYEGKFGFSDNKTYVNPLNAFPILIGALSKILVTVIMVLSFLTLIVAGVMMASDGAAGTYSKGKELIIKVLAGLVLLGTVGIILKLINPNIFG